MVVSAGCRVSLEYTLKNDGGEVLDSNVGNDPLTYTHGGSDILPKLEDALAGLGAGDSKQVTLPPVDGYGEVDDSAIVEVPLSVVPEGARKPGTRLQGKAPDGQIVTPLVVEIRESTAVLDFNHPLAGETLHFDVTVTAVAVGEAGGGA